MVFGVPVAERRRVAPLKPVLRAGVQRLDHDQMPCVWSQYSNSATCQSFDPRRGVM
jgi:hypothetical protein